MSSKNIFQHSLLKDALGELTKVFFTEEAEQELHNLLTLQIPTGSAEYAPKLPSGALEKAKTKVNGAALLLAALDSKVKSLAPGFGYAIGENGSLIVKYTIGGVTTIAVRDNDKVFAAHVEDGQLSKEKYSEELVNYMTLAPLVLEDEEFRRELEELYDKLSLAEDGYDKSAIQKASLSIARLSSNVYYGAAHYLEMAKVKPAVIDASNVFPLTEVTLASGKYEPKEASIVGDVDEFVFKEEAEGSVPTGGMGCYATGTSVPESEYTHVIPEYMKIGKLEKELADIIADTEEDEEPTNTLLFYGPAGTGKSCMASNIAYMMRKNLYTFSVGPNTEEKDLLRSCMPDTENGGFKYVDSQILKAVADPYGAVLEIQEPTIALLQGLFASINSLLDSRAELTLIDGTKVKRKNSLVVIYTTNVGAAYGGTKVINASVLDRVNVVKEIDQLTKAEMISRVNSVVKGFENKALLSKMADVIIKLIDNQESEEITDGIVSMRSFISWANITKRKKNPIRAAELTVIDKASTDKEVREDVREIITSIINPRERY